MKCDILAPAPSPLGQATYVQRRAYFHPIEHGRTKDDVFFALTLTLRLSIDRLLTKTRVKSDPSGVRVGIDSPGRHRASST